MPEYARGLILKVTDRNQFDAYISEHAADPGTQMENWGHNSVPEAIYIARYNRDDPSYYKAYDKHVNGEVSWNYWAEPLLQGMVEEGILQHTGNYDVAFVDEQDD